MVSGLACGSLLEIQKVPGTRLMYLENGWVADATLIQSTKQSIITEMKLID
jgi:hypothetical protein